MMAPHRDISRVACRMRNSPRLQALPRARPMHRQNHPERLTWCQSGDTLAPMEPRTRRSRLSIDAPAFVIATTKRSAERFYRGSLNETVLAALSLFQWLVRQRSAGRRVIAVPADQMPNAFEEPVLPGLEEAMSPKWNWLVEREHPWRRQLWIKGRRIAAGDLARTVEIEGWSPEQAADEFDLPVDAVEEAVRYLAESRDLVLAEERENLLAAATGAQSEFASSG